jgi:ribonuclease P protein component
VATNPVGHHRLGLVVQKRFFDAVRRNRVKRCLREWFRLQKQHIPLPCRDIVIVARPGAERLKTEAITHELFHDVISRLGTDRNG